jgi:hypothetical protein
MHRHPTACPTLPLGVSDAIAERFSQLQRWNEARKLRKLRRRRAQILSQLTARILYDIGESDCRPLGSFDTDIEKYGRKE